MLAAGIEISVQYPKCDAAAPLGGPPLRVHCDRCQTDFELGPLRRTSPYVVKMYERTEP